ncbi:hypothetical protein KUV62_17990 [Salipiger bermudensis]|uniref:hypothetical protein n=1 Tax=Salipiger bermudensis TaxID=344736 RepID=UPI001C98EB1D|nr:hypothetical protein [Salipiger bermudensis]MBY6005816.1 hypothetical protein [Salipiger bermudensis]
MSYHTTLGTGAPRQAPAAIDAARLVTRALLGLLGAGLLIAAFGFWLVPGATYSPELMLAKLGLSLFLLITGLSCLIGARGERV